ncbi:MAG TPA: DUF2070 family protein, partial [Candidatus Bathyarchaeia archaeon]|nr:DUF2070 family protein [Candidatus Bathyarchaeia archaeon]
TRLETGVGGTVDAFNFIRRVAFPTTPQVVLIFAVVAVFSTILALIPAGEGPVQSIMFAFGVLVIPAVVGAILSAGLLSSHDNVLDFRRLMGMEFVAFLPLAIILPVSSITGVLWGAKQLWEQGFLIGLALSLPTRFLTALAMSPLSAWRKLGVGMATPIITGSAFLSLTPSILPDSNLTVIAPRVYALLTLGIAVSAIGTSLIVRGVEREGSSEIGHSPMGLFRAFLDHWLHKRSDPLEERLLTLSKPGDIETRILSFSGADSKPLSTIIVSNFHPGPYRDLGSGGLPSEIKRAVELSRHTVVQVPHSISNHKLNIVSHRDINRLLEAIGKNYPSHHPTETASKMVREQVGEAVVSGQAFGRVALLTVTLAPEEMEDLPTEVVTEIDREAMNHGLQALTV